MKTTKTKRNQAQARLERANADRDAARAAGNERAASRACARSWRAWCALRALT